MDGTLLLCCGCGGGVTHPSPSPTSVPCPCPFHVPIHFYPYTSRVVSIQKKGLTLSFFDIPSHTLKILRTGYGSTIQVSKWRGVARLFRILGG